MEVHASVTAPSHIRRTDAGAILANHACKAHVTTGAAVVWIAVQILAETVAIRPAGRADAAVILAGPARADVSADPAVFRVCCQIHAPSSAATGESGRTRAFTPTLPYLTRTYVITLFLVATAPNAFGIVSIRCGKAVSVPAICGIAPNACGVDGARASQVRNVAVAIMGDRFVQ